MKSAGRKARRFKFAPIKRLTVPAEEAAHLVINPH